MKNKNKLSKIKKVYLQVFLWVVIFPFLLLSCFNFVLGYYLLEPALIPLFKCFIFTLGLYAIDCIVIYILHKKLSIL